MVMLLAYLGLFRQSKFLLAITCVLLFTLLFYPPIYLPMSGDITVSVPQSIGLAARAFRDIKSVTLESPIEDLRLFGMFLTGSCFYIFRDSVAYRRHYAFLAAIFLTFCMFFNHLAEPAVAVFGGYLIFWFAFEVKPLSASRFFNKTDLSYGIYLYAWPVQKILILKFHPANPYLLFITAWVLSAILAYASWSLIEKPFLSLKSLYRPKPKPAESMIV